MLSQNQLFKGTSSDSIKKTLVVLTVGILLGTTATFFKDSFAEISNDQLRQCENLYFNFKKFGEKEFVYRYTFKSFIKECLKLYHDPEWTFNGKDKIDKYFEKQEAAKNSEQPTSEVQISITQKYKIDETRYVISFDACAYSSKTQAVFLISSDIDNFIGISQKLIPQDSCSTYWTNVYAKYPDTIGIQYVKDLKAYADLFKKELRN